MKERKNGKTGGTGAGYRRVLLTCLYMVLAFSLTFATGFILFILKLLKKPVKGYYDYKINP